MLPSTFDLKDGQPSVSVLKCKAKNNVMENTWARMVKMMDWKIYDKLMHPGVHVHQ